MKRDGVTIHTFTNVQAGDVMTYEDAVADYGAYEYTIVGYNNNLEGEEFSQVAIVGPNCTWKLVGTTTNFQGWNGGALQFIGANGVVFKTVTMANSTPLSVKFQMPEGGFTLNWVAPNTAVQTMTFTLKDSANQNAYAFSGSSTQLNGTIYSGSATSLARPILSSATTVLNLSNLTAVLWKSTMVSVRVDASKSAKRFWNLPKA